MSAPKYERVEDRYCPHCGGSNMTKLSEVSPGGKHRYRCRDCTKRTNNPLYKEPQILPKAKISELRGKKFYGITSAINDTPIIKEAHETFKKIVEDHNGAYLVVPTVYRNPDLYHEAIQQTYSWPEEILDHICNVNFSINNSVMIKGETRLTHTRQNPLSGKANAGTIKSEIYAHAQVAMEMVATPRDELPKMMHTTGTISKPNYGGSDTAQRAKDHHNIAMLVIEVEGDKFWPWVVEFDGEGAYFLDSYYTPKKITRNCEASGALYGDIHSRVLREKSVELLSQLDSVFRPAKRIYGDVHDNNTGSHHTKNDVIYRLRQYYEENKSLCMRNELDQSIKFLENRNNAFLTDANHDRHLDQWLNAFVPKHDPLNAPIYYELMSYISQAFIDKRFNAGAFQLYLEHHCKSTLNFIDPNKPFFIEDIDCSQHGDRGPNGSRGSAKGFARSGYKTFIGHSHTARIEKNSWQVGTTELDHDYAQGYSSWTVTHGFIFPNGCRTLCHIVKDKFSPALRKRVTTASTQKRKKYE
jgi:hypothetical protein